MMGFLGEALEYFWSAASEKSFMVVTIIISTRLDSFRRMMDVSELKKNLAGLRHTVLAQIEIVVNLH